MRFRYYTPASPIDPATPEPEVLSVDGVTPAGPNLSHWPGNRTPTTWKHDVSTGIVLRFMSLPEAERRRFLGDVEIVTNNHLDTDGILSVATILQPDLALKHRERMISAARSGDFQILDTPEGLLIDLSLSWLTLESDAALQLVDLPEAERRQRQYELALDALPQLLADPHPLDDVVAAEFQRILDDVDAVKRGDVEIENEPELGLAIVTSDRALQTVAVHFAAGAAQRVLEILPFRRGHLYRLRERVDGWFDVPRPTLPRRPWASLAARLDDLEASESEPHWTAQPIDTPIPELYFGVPGSGRAFGPFPPGELCVSRLKPRLVRHLIVEHYEEGA